MRTKVSEGEVHKFNDDESATILKNEEGIPDQE
jgi:hypothetical protein